MLLKLSHTRVSLATILARNVETISKTKHEIRPHFPDSMQCCHVAVFVDRPELFDWLKGGGGGGGGASKNSR